MLPGVRVLDLKKNVDDRGSFAELMRSDWKELLGDDTIVQVNLSQSYPGMIRGWHRHARGQVDYFIVLNGSLKICAYDDRQDSKTRGQLDEVVAAGERLQVVRIPGFYWHGTKALGNELALRYEESGRGTTRMERPNDNRSKDGEILRLEQATAQVIAS